ncbi:unnamed protein product [Diamesa tonsa]
MLSFSCNTFSMVFVVCFCDSNTSLHESCDIKNPTSSNGNVVYLDDCPKVFQVFKKQVKNNDDVNFINSRYKGKINNKHSVCCEIETTPTTPTPTTPTPTTPIPTTATPLVSSYLPTAPVCGSYIEDRIVGGNNTKIDEFPWTALMQYTYPDGDKGFHCGGALISNRYVLTASHCVNGRGIVAAGYNLTGVRLGEWNLATERDCDDSFEPPYCSHPHRDIEVEESFPHEDYDPNSRNQHNDIALLRLSEKIEKFTTFIKPICLPLEESVRNFDLTNKMMNVTGWGRTFTSRQSDIKQKVGLKGVDQATCQKSYLNSKRKIVSSQICAGGETGRDSCTGDSGGPLMRENLLSKDPHWYLVGLVSYGPIICGQLDFPGVYTRVDHYIDWIINKMEP